MNPTKNVSMIEVDDQIFEKVCDAKMKDMILAIQTQYKELEEPLNYITNKIYNKSLEYAIFTKELLDEGIQISLEDILIIFNCVLII